MNFIHIEILSYKQFIPLTLWTAALFAFSAKPTVRMLRYFLTKQSFFFSLLLVLYLVVVLFFIGVIPVKASYQYVVFLIAGLVLLFFPHLFTSPRIQNPYRYVEGTTSFQFIGKKGDYLPINAPELGIFSVGVPGCGKTKYIIEPTLFRMIRKGYGGILYDYDFSSDLGKHYSLSTLAYNCCLNSSQKTRFFSVNFQDLSVSSRINPIAPNYIQDRKKLSRCLRTFLLNLNPHLSQREDFWQKNTYALLKSLVVFLANKHPRYCSIPHVIMLGLQSADSMKAILYADEEAKLYASPVLDALEHADEQFAGVIANFKVSLERLLDPAIFWVLSGDEVPPIINDPKHPIVLCLGNTPSEKDVLSPVLAMTIAALVSNMYGHDRNKSFVIIDELPTLFLPNLNEIPATARKYNIATVVALQTLAQLEKTYGVLGAREMQETFGNHIVGRSAFRLSKELSDMFGRTTSQSTSKTVSDSHRISTTTHKKDKSVIDPQKIMALAVGEFAGRVADSGQGFFKMKLQPIDAYNPQLHHKHFKPLPVVHEHVDTSSHFTRIQQEISQLVSQYS